MSTSSRSRSGPVPTGAAALLFLLAAIPLAALRVTDWRVLLIVVAAVIVVLASDALAAPAPSQIDVVREFPASMTLGERGELRWRIENRTGRQARIAVADASWPSLQASRRSTTCVLGPDRSHRFGARIEPVRRGRFPFAAVTVRTTGPLRLMYRQLARNQVDSLAVLPAHPSADDLVSRHRVPLESGSRSVRARGSGTDFDQLREYQPGDDIRKLDWAATARSSKAIVRDHRAERNQHLVVLLDNGRAMAGTVGESPRVEHAMDAVMGLTRVATHVGDNVGLVTFDTQVRTTVAASNSKAQFHRVTEAMYLLEPQFDESSYRVAFDTAASRFRRRSLFVVFTDVAGAVIADELVPAVANLARTHLVMVAAVRDPDAAARAHERPAEGNGAYRSAAAVAALDGRERAIALLERSGAIVVDSRPGDLAVDVVDRYLELKAQGRL